MLHVKNVITIGRLQSMSTSWSGFRGILIVTFGLLCLHAWEKTKKQIKTHGHGWSEPLSKSVPKENGPGSKELGFLIVLHLSEESYYWRLALPENPCKQLHRSQGELTGICDRGRDVAWTRSLPLWSQKAERYVWREKRNKQETAALPLRRTRGSKKTFFLE